MLALSLFFFSSLFRTQPPTSLFAVYQAIPIAPLSQILTTYPHTHIPGGNELRCLFTSDPKAVGSAQAVVFHARDLRLDTLPPKSPSALWIYWSDENPAGDYRECGWHNRLRWNDRWCDKVPSFSFLHFLKQNKGKKEVMSSSTPDSSVSPVCRSRLIPSAWRSSICAEGISSMLTFPLLTSGAL